MRMIVILYGICALLSVGLDGLQLPKGLATAYLNANNGGDMRRCPKSHIFPREHVPFNDVNDVENVALKFFACLMYFVNNVNIEFEEMYKYHDTAVFMEDGEEMTFDQFATKSDDGRYTIDYLSITISILEFDAYSMKVALKSEFIFEEDFGAGTGKHFMITTVKHKYNKNGQLIYAKLDSEKHFIDKILNPSTKKGNAAFQIGFGDHIDYFNDNNQYGWYILFIIILLLLNLCALYKHCCSIQRGIKYKKARAYDVESSESES